MATETIDPRVRRTSRDIVQAASEILLADGWSAVSSAAVAKRAGYSKATIYAHWPTQVDLIRDAVKQIGDLSVHHEPTGDLRADLIGELFAFGEGLTKHHLARVLGGLAERAGTDPAIDEFSRHLHREGDRPLHDILSAHLPPADVDMLAATLSGAVLYRAMIQDRTPTRAFIEQLVDRMLTTTQPAP